MLLQPNFPRETPLVRLAAADRIAHRYHRIAKADGVMGFYFGPCGWNIYRLQMADMEEGLLEWHEPERFSFVGLFLCLAGNGCCRVFRQESVEYIETL